VAGGFGLDLLEQDLGRLFADLLHLGDDAGEATAVGDPLLVEAGLALAQPSGDGLAGVPSGPLPVGAVKLRRVGIAATARGSAVGVSENYAALADEAEIEDLEGELAVAALELFQTGR
jgi:hypothetical protein